jgi:protein ImuB
MVPLACVNVADLPLQLLLKKHPQWRDLPTAVVSKDSPYGRIITTNVQAKEYGILPGIRYAAGLSFTFELRADTIADNEIRAGSVSIAAALRHLSPRVEAHELDPGVFWLDAGGLSSLFQNMEAWCGKVRNVMLGMGYQAAVAVGFSRFGCYAAAKSTRDQVIFTHAQDERAAALEAEINILSLASEVLERLEMLGIRTVGSFLDLPLGGVRKRFGPEVERLYRFAAGALDLPLQPTEEEQEPEYFHKLPCPEASSVRLLHYLQRSLSALTGGVKSRHRLIRELRISFVLEDGELALEPILPSRPSVDSGLLLELIALRLDNRRLPGAAEAIKIAALTVPERNIQTELFPGSSTENFQEVDKVFSRLRATFGNSCIQRARLEDEHLPELSYSWESLERLRLGGEKNGVEVQNKRARRAVRQAVRRVVRRIFEQPRTSPDLHVPKLWGPYPISSCWWSAEQRRDYFFAEAGNGEILWLYFDRMAKQWLQIGVLE